MNTCHLNHPIELEGPCGMTVEAALSINYTHYSLMGSGDRLSVDYVSVLVGSSRLDFNGDIHSCSIVDACWQDWRNRVESIESEQAEFIRWEES